jgi:hypothetical protein
MSAPTREPAEVDKHFVVVLGCNRAAVLLVPTTAGYSVPSVSIPQHVRPAEHLSHAVRERWGIKALCLFNLDAEGGEQGENRNQVMELCSPDCSHARGAEWVSFDRVPECRFSTAGESNVINALLQIVNDRSCSLLQGPFSRVGWFDAVCNWVEQVIEPLGLRLTDHYSQWNADPVVSLIRLETSGPAVWFKAVAHVSSHEYLITIMLGRLFPQYLPTLLGTKAEWHGWLAMEAAGQDLNSDLLAGRWIAAARALTQLQTQSMHKHLHLLQAGALDFRIGTLRDVVVPFTKSVWNLIQARGESGMPNKEDLAELCRVLQWSLL